MDWIVEARRRIEHRAASHGRVHIRELATLDAVGDDRGELPGEGLHVCHHDVPRLGNQLDIGLEQLRVLERPTAWRR